MLSTSRAASLRVKRLLDIVLALIGLTLASPVMLAVGLLVAVKLGRPVIFRQSRPGRDTQLFEVLKFRSMLEVDEERGLVSDEERLTDFGRILRSTSLDELPSLVNILRGEMSFVGPRPTLARYLELFTPEERRRYEVRPGLTGLAQVRGRNGLPWPDRLRSDIEYVDDFSLLLDLRIMLRTIVVVLRREGINAPGHVCADQFRGTAVMETAGA